MDRENRAIGRRRKIALATAWIVFAAAAVLADPAGAEIYKWVEENGRVHFGNRPQSGATEHELSGDTRINTSKDGADPAAKRDRENRLRDRAAAAKRRGRAAEAYERREGARREEQDAPRVKSVSESQEERCQKIYGQSCDDLRNWKQRVIEDCERRNLSRDCTAPKWLNRRKPKTIEHKKAIRRYR